MTQLAVSPLRTAVRCALFATTATLVALALATAPANAQRAPDDARPGGVELRPIAPPAPAGADMAPSPSMLFKKPTVTPPVLPTPPPAVAPAAAAAPVVQPATPPPTIAPAAEKPVVTPPATAPTPPSTAPAKPDAKKKAVEPPRTGATRSFRYESLGSGAPAGAASESAPAPSGRMKGDDRLPGGVERAPGRE